MISHIAHLPETTPTLCSCDMAGKCSTGKMETHGVGPRAAQRQRVGCDPTAEHTVHLVAAPSVYQAQGQAVNSRTRLPLTSACSGSDSVILNGSLPVSGLFIPGAPFTSPLMFLRCFILLPIWCQLMPIPVFTENGAAFALLDLAIISPEHACYHLRR